MTNILLFVVIAIGIGIRILPILDSFVELIQHYIGLQIQKIDKQMQKVAMEVQKEFG